MMDERTTTLTLLKEFISQTEERIRNITGDLVFNEVCLLFIVSYSCSLLEKIIYFRQMFYKTVHFLTITL